MNMDAISVSEYKGYDYEVTVHTGIPQWVHITVYQVSTSKAVCYINSPISKANAKFRETVDTLAAWDEA